MRSNRSNGLATVRPARRTGVVLASVASGREIAAVPQKGTEMKASSAATRMDKGLKTLRLGSLQVWMFKRGWRRLPNALSTARWLLWRATGGGYDD